MSAGKKLLLIQKKIIHDKFEKCWEDNILMLLNYSTKVIDMMPKNN